MNKEEIQALLAQLGNTADEVAANLNKQGIKGYRYGDGGFCPINQYLSNHGVVCSVGPYTLHVGKEYDEEVELPSVAERFISRFDGGQYTFLRIYKGEFPLLEERSK